MADSANILALQQVPVGSACAYAPLGTTLPTTAVEALDAAFVDLGYVTDEGVTNTPKRDTTKHYAWNGKTVKVTMDKYTETCQVSLYESSENVLKAIFDDANVTVDEASGHQQISVEHTSLQLDHKCFVFTGVDGDRTVRIVVRNGQITEIGDIVWVHSKPTVYELTIDVFETAAGDNGVVVLFDNADVLAGS